MATYVVYCHTNKINGKKYVGLTRNANPAERWGSNGINYRNSKCFYGAIQKYGWSNFEHEILESELTAEEAEEKEKYYIKLFNSMVPNGYNVTGGGEHKKFISEETREKLHVANFGRKLSDETKQKMSQSRMGHPGYRLRPIWMCDKTTKERIKFFPSILKAAEFLSIPGSQRHITHTCQNKRPSAYGYFWEYA